MRVRLHCPHMVCWAVALLANSTRTAACKFMVLAFGGPQNAW
jgi:hypothetical protein